MGEQSSPVGADRVPPESLEHRGWSVRRVIFAIIMVVLAIVSLVLLYRFRTIVLSSLLAIALSTAIQPAVTWLHQHGISRELGVLVAYALLLAIVVIGVILLMPLVFEQVVELAARLPEYYSEFRDLLLHVPSRFVQRLGQALPLRLGLGAPAAPSQGEAPGGQPLDQAAQFLVYIGLVARTVLGMIFILLLGFYWTLEREWILRHVLLLVSDERRDKARLLVAEIGSKVGAYVRAQMFLCLVVGSMALIAYVLIGLPEPVPLALVAGITEAIPLVGPVLGTIPAGLVALSVAPIKLIWVVLAAVVIQQLENYLLVPRVMSQVVGVNAIVALLALAAFGSLFGLPGALLAIPIAATVQLLLDRWVANLAEPLKPEPGEQQVVVSRDRITVLRYQAQELVQDVRKQTQRLQVPEEEYAVQIEDAVETIAADIDSLLAQAAQDAGFRDERAR